MCSQNGQNSSDLKQVCFKVQYLGSINRKLPQLLIEFKNNKLCNDQYLYASPNI